MFEAGKQWIGMSEEETKSIIFSDESKINLIFYIDGNVSAWRTPCEAVLPEHIILKVKHGGAV
jgi:hypothetical protein